jgi:hypothetical protein
MNRFVELIQKFKEQSSDEDQRLLETLDDIKEPAPEVSTNGTEHGLRLPYSSDPRPIEESWN